MVRGILSIGNPVIYWMIPLVVMYGIIKFFEEKKFLFGWLLFAFFSQWMVWAFIHRVQFFHYFYPVMPYIAILFGIILSRIWDSGSLGRGVVVFYLTAVFVMFVYWYPLLTGYPIPNAYYSHHMWFHHWI